MTKKEKIIEARKQHKDYLTIVEEIGCNYDYVKEVCKECGLLYSPDEKHSRIDKNKKAKESARKQREEKRKRELEERKQKVIELRQEGLTYQEIADAVGYKSDAPIANICRQYGLSENAIWKEKRHNAWREYKSQGHTMQEVADKFGISIATAQQVCKGIAPQQATLKVYRNQYTSGKYDREANAIRYINERTPWFEYAGNYTGVDGFVDLKCKTCGSVITKSFVSVRHGHARCDVCRQKEIDAYREKKKAERAKQAEEERQNRPTRKYKRLFEADIKQLEFPTCECCGNIFIPRKQGTKYCSELCMKRIANASHKDRRIKKLKHIVIDKDITLEKLYNRDDGVCYICGQQCDWNDYEVRDDGTFIAFDNYPSIDHIEPISKGGLHSWDNVRLACRKCNYLKRDSISPRSA